MRSLRKIVSQGRSKNLKLFIKAGFHIACVPSICVYLCVCIFVYFTWFSCVYFNLILFRLGYSCFIMLC